MSENEAHVLNILGRVSFEVAVHKPRSEAKHRKCTLREDLGSILPKGLSISWGCIAANSGDGWDGSVSDLEHLMF